MKIWSIANIFIVNGMLVVLQIKTLVQYFYYHFSIGISNSCLHTYLFGAFKIHKYITYVISNKTSFKTFHFNECNEMHLLGLGVCKKNFHHIP